MDGMMKFEVPQTDGLCVVVNENQVEAYRGWRLAAVLYTDRVDTQRTLTGDATVYGEKLYKEETRVLREPRFVLVQEKESALVALTERNLSLAGENERSARKIQSLEEAAQKFDKQRGELDTKLRQETDRAANAVKYFEEEATRRRKLEADIGRIRAAVGELRMKEILGG